jgi:hypothetical protein
VAVDDDFDILLEWVTQFLKDPEEPFHVGEAGEA